MALLHAYALTVAGRGHDAMADAIEECLHALIDVCWL